MIGFAWVLSIGTWLLAKGGALAASLIGLDWRGLAGSAGKRARTAFAGPYGQALAAALVAVVALGIVGVLMSRAASEATAARDSEWKSKLAIQRAAQILAQRQRDRAAEAAAETERRWLSTERDGAVKRAAELERELALLAAKPDGDPVIYPRTLARSLRK